MNVDENNSKPQHSVAEEHLMQKQHAAKNHRRKLARRKEHVDRISPVLTTKPRSQLDVIEDEEFGLLDIRNVKSIQRLYHGYLHELPEE